MGGPVKGRADYLKLGTWNATCSMCGRKIKADETVKNWMGAYRCSEHNEPRHPQDFVRAVPDVMSVPWSQPPIETFVNICSFNGRSAIPDFALPDCAIPDNPVIDVEVD